MALNVLYVRNEGADVKNCGDRSESHRKTACSLALALVFSEYWLLSYCAFPLFDGVFFWTREVSACAGGLVLAALALVSFWRPFRASDTMFMRGGFACMMLGAAFIGMGLAVESVAATVAGASFVTVAGGLANIYVGKGCIGLDPRDAGIAIAWGYLASLVARWVFAWCPLWLNAAFFVVFPLVAMAIIAAIIAPFRTQLSSAPTESPAHLSVTAPDSFLPFGHQVFVSLVVFRFVYGYTLTFGEVDRIPVFEAAALVPICAVVAFMMAHPKPLSADSLFRASILFSTAGFLAVAVTDDSGDGAANALLAAGTGLFEILMYYVLISVGTKNPAGALPALAWGNAMASWGTIFGAMFGRFAGEAYSQGESLPSVVAAAIVLGLMAYVLFMAGRFSFSRTIDNVLPAAESPVIEVEGADESDSIDERCVVLADQAGLTEREKEVFALLARGRNARFIQEELTVSYNTVKTHVSHIYAKLGVHTHQELIDRVERERL